MPDLAALLADTVGGFQIEGRMMRYSQFVPRLYNLCLSLGFEAGRMLPSRAFCSDESQGYPIIMLAKHFGAFPFNHGRVGGIVATDRHGPHAHHGRDLVLIQASHVGYDPDEHRFGSYRRLQTEGHDCTPTCGKVFHVMEWYQEEFHFARENILVECQPGQCLVTIDNQLLRADRENGLLLHIERLVDSSDGGITPVRILSTAKTFHASPTFTVTLRQAGIGAEPQPVGKLLSAELFHFNRTIESVSDELHQESHIEHNLIRFMPHILTAPSPILMAAQLNTQVEFDRTFRTIVKEHAYSGRRLLFLAGLNIDISPTPGQVFPLTKFVPWAAYLQRPDGSHSLFEQEEIFSMLKAQASDNPDQIDLEEAIRQMTAEQEVRVGLQ
jgi:hypothetical protein